MDDKAMRDAFASAALVGVIPSNPGFRSSGNPGSEVWDRDRKEWANKIAKTAYVIADAMIEARK